MSVTEIKRLLRSEARELDEKIAKIRSEADEKVRKLESERDQLGSALAGLGANGTKRTTVRRKRQPVMKTQQQILDHLRAHSTESFAVPALAKALDLNRTTVRAALVGGWGRLDDRKHRTAAPGLVPSKRVTVVDETPQGGPIVKHKPTTVRPGEEVKS